MSRAVGSGGMAADDVASGGTGASTTGWGEVAAWPETDVGPEIAVAARLRKAKCSMKRSSTAFRARRHTPRPVCQPYQTFRSSQLYDAAR